MFNIILINDITKFTFTDDLTFFYKMFCYMKKMSKQILLFLFISFHLALSQHYQLQFLFDISKIEYQHIQNISVENYVTSTIITILSNKPNLTSTIFNNNDNNPSNNININYFSNRNYANVIYIYIFIKKSKNTNILKKKTV